MRQIRIKQTPEHEQHIPVGHEAIKPFDWADHPDNHIGRQISEPGHDNDLAAKRLSFPLTTRAHEALRPALPEIEVFDVDPWAEAGAINDDSFHRGRMGNLQRVDPTKYRPE